MIPNPFENLGRKIKIKRKNRNTEMIDKMYYLWKDKSKSITGDSAELFRPHANLFYITDYKEIREDGKVKIDNHGYLDVELVSSSNVKTDLIAHAQKLTMQ